MKVVKEYPRIFEEEEGDELFKTILFPELKEVIMASTRSNIPGPNGWTMELFMECFEIMGLDLLRAVEGSRTRGVITGSMNSTSVALIPKKFCFKRPGGFLSNFIVQLCIQNYCKDNCK